MMFEGILFYEQTVKDLVNAVKVFETTGVRWSADEIKANSENFSVVHFKERYSSFIEQCIDKQHNREDKMIDVKDNVSVRVHLNDNMLQ